MFIHILMFIPMFISKLTCEIESPFTAKMIAEIDVELELNKTVLLAFDVLNVTISLPESERIESVNTLSNLYGNEQYSKFKGDLLLISTSKVASSTNNCSILHGNVMME